MVTFEAKKRDVLGKKAQKFRREGLIPGVLMERRRDSVPLLLDKLSFLKTYREAKDVAVADLNLGDESYKVIVSELQLDPISGDVIHINFRKIHEGEKITTTVPIRFEGTSEALERGEGLLLTLLDELEIETLPKYLPSEATVAISSLTEIGDSLKIKDLDIDLENVQILGHESDDLVAKLEEPEMEELEEIEEDAIFGFEEEFAAEEEGMEGETAEGEDVPEGEEGAVPESGEGEGSREPEA